MPVVRLGEAPCPVAIRRYAGRHGSATHRGLDLWRDMV